MSRPLNQMPDDEVLLQTARAMADEIQNHLTALGPVPAEQLAQIL